MSPDESGRLGATWLGDDRCRFELWAPNASHVDVLVDEREFSLTRTARGYWTGVAESVALGGTYRFRLDGREIADPCSRHQPEGPSGPSEIVQSDWPWRDSTWRGVPLEDLVLYELHVGTFSEAGDFEGVVPALEVLRSMGITAIELLPVAQAATDEGWGYNTAFPFAVHASYGGPSGLRRLVEACHECGLAVVLDFPVVGIANGVGELHFAPYTDPDRLCRHGPALNLDGPGSDEVRRFILDSALEWITDYHMDGLRIGTVDSIADRSARPFLNELVLAIQQEAGRLGRRIHMFASGDENDARWVAPHGAGFDAMWSPDFGMSMHALLTRDSVACEDFGRMEHLARAWQHGFAFEGQYSRTRRRRFGSLSRGIRGDKFVVSAQDHEQIGVRTGGFRLAQRCGLASCRLVAGTLLLAPRVPLLFMGEEYGELAPFANSEGRSRIRHDLRREPGHRELRALYAELLRLRRTIPALRDFDPARVETHVNEARQVMFARRGQGESKVFAVFCFATAASDMPVPLPPGRWRLRADSEDVRWGGAGTVLPVEVESNGEVSLRIGARSFSLWERAFVRRFEDG